MRPRVFPAEDAAEVARHTGSTSCFNEAAGIPRGRTRDGTLHGAQGRLASMRPRGYSPRKTSSSAVQSHACQRASMRPRVFPAEDSSGRP